jgi:hypothetical protein
MIPMEWLDARVSVEQAEQDNTRPTSGGGTPFGGVNDRWEAMKAMMIEGDELWTFCSPAASWEHHAGRQGIALVRAAEVVGVLVTLMN